MSDQPKSRGPDDELLAICAAGSFLQARAEAPIGTAEGAVDGHDADKLIEEATALWSRAARMLAKTPQGMQAKAALFQNLFHSEDHEMDLIEELACSIARDVRAWSSAG